MKDKLAEEILFGYRLKAGGMTEADMIEAMQAYHEAKLKEVTDEDIQNHFLKYAWAINKHGEIAPKIHHHIEGAKAFRDGLIKHIEA